MATGPKKESALKPEVAKGAGLAFGTGGRGFVSAQLRGIPATVGD